VSGREIPACLGVGSLSVAVASAVGAGWRWGLGMALTPLFPTLPLGTLAAESDRGLLWACDGAVDRGTT